jgi:3-oxoacyl-[acyl-carrier-protein] synthase I
VKKIFIESSNIISSLGFTTEENFRNVLNEQTGIKQTSLPQLPGTVVPLSLVDENILTDKLTEIKNPSNFTKLEQLIILSLTDCLRSSKIDVKNKRTLLILSSTKGNIELLDTNSLQENKNDLELWKTADKIANYFGFVNRPLVVSNACISGVAACVVGKRLIDSNQYDNIVVVGADVLSKFIVSGFQSFKSLSEQPCKPFDADRDGLSLGEGVGSIILTNNERLVASPKITLQNGAISNDANHISGPSRTGEGLYIAINKTIGSNTNIDLISAHGTATPYSDDMESKAIYNSGLENVPVVSTKGYTGHTLGAAGIIETVLGIEAMKKNTLIKTLGFKKFGVVQPIKISDTTTGTEIQTMLKLASGFGGCNAAALFKKHDA